VGGLTSTGVGTGVGDGVAVAVVVPGGGKVVGGVLAAGAGIWTTGSSVAAGG
jgi:hypothetical protein